MSAQHRRQLHGLIQQYYASAVLRNGGSDAAISQFIQYANDQDFLAYAKAEMLRMSKLDRRRDFVSSIGAEFIKNAIAQL